MERQQNSLHVFLCYPFCVPNIWDRFTAIPASLVEIIHVDAINIWFVQTKPPKPQMTSSFAKGENGTTKTEAVSNASNTQWSQWMTHEDNVRNSSAFLLVEYATAIAIASLTLMCLGYLWQLGERRKEQLPDPSLPFIPSYPTLFNACHTGWEQQGWIKVNFLNCM